MKHDTWPKYFTYDRSYNSCFRVDGPLEPVTLIIWDEQGVIRRPCSDATVDLLLNWAATSFVHEIPAEEMKAIESKAILEHATQ